ncbi:MAG: aminopeptidase P family protein [Gammaproteobacteria bacterium]|nr:aminopeptidase P family protein [Gammaproteobacteria bacterium]
MKGIKDRLGAVRAEMAAVNLDAFLIPRADEYLGEYVPEHNERLRWISGFTGSAGVVIVLKEHAVIFVDGRYTIQVQRQVPAKLFDFHHLIEKPPLKWLSKTLEQGARVGFDSRLHPYSFYKSASALLASSNMELVEVDSNPIDNQWIDRPSPEPRLAILLGEEFSGEHSSSKRQRIGTIIEDSGSDVALITQLDSIAWLLNIRGSDVPHLPVLLGFAILNKNGEMTFFTDARKIPNDLHQHVGEGVAIQDESKVVEALRSLGNESMKVLADEATVNAFSVLRCIEYGCEIIAGKDPVLVPKAQKNSTELAGMRNCHLRDGSAVSRYLAWIEREVSAGNLHDEGTLADKLESFRRELSHIHDLSFDTISAAGANGAMCHYHHTNGTPAKLEMHSLYLVDSGGQYSDGTTDVTRTVAIGEPSDEHRHMFTLVLKGHIALATCVFPIGTTGVQLDVLARQFLWQEGLDYDHGTGHGVGSFLSVHEGPIRIGKASVPMAELLPGMVLSNEPGYYKEDCYGIRCENLMIVVARGDSMLAFETITFAPFDLRLVDMDLMTQAEISWLDQYHIDVREKLSPMLKGDDLQWLERSTRVI